MSDKKMVNNVVYRVALQSGFEHQTRLDKGEDISIHSVIDEVAENFILTHEEEDAFLKVHPDMFTNSGIPYLDDDVDEMMDKFYENLSQWLCGEVKYAIENGIKN